MVLKSFEPPFVSSSLSLCTCIRSGGPTIDKLNLRYPCNARQGAKVGVKKKKKKGMDEKKNT